MSDSECRHGQSELLLQRQTHFWRLLQFDLLASQPQCPPFAHSRQDDLSIDYNQKKVAPERPYRLAVTVAQRQELRTKHRAFVSALLQERYELPYEPNAKGIVTTAGGKYLPVALVSVRMLRETGCELPVEVFLASQDEWDTEICDKILPGLNARCVVLAEILQGTALEIHKYQYKILSIVFSSFEDVLFLDADCFPIRDPTKYFTSRPFVDTGMIIWPDIWYPSESPEFFEIADLAMPGLAQRPATESGELLYSIPRHADSLLLAMYYNFHGPDYYYPLQSQGAPGEGDKETFLWSAIVFNEPFYAVSTGVEALGYKTTKSEWRGSAMVQFDSLENFKDQRSADLQAQENTNPAIRPLFVHANFPKIDPGQVFLNTSFGASGPTRDADGSMRRIWHETAEKGVDFFGFDVEYHMWKVVRDIACEYEHRLRAWEGSVNICQQASEYWDAVFEGK
jgi:alpha 1,2-mannosyltransferase